MQPKTCNSAIWIMVLLASLLLTLQGRIGLLAIVLPVALLSACATPVGTLLLRTYAPPGKAVA